MIGPENVPEHLRVEPVIGTEWVWPNDPRASQMEREAANAGSHATAAAE
jgi:hypothetical protein